LKVLLVADNCSRKMGGEAILPYHYFRLLTAQGHETFLVVHERCRDEVLELFPAQADKITFLEDTPAQKKLWTMGTKLPRRVAEVSLWFLVNMSTSSRMKKAAQRLVAEKAIDVVHQVTPVSPKSPSHLYGLGAPVVIGPMNGGMIFPPAFQKTIRLSERISYAVGKSMGTVVNFFVPGKHKAALLLAANPRTADSLREVVGPKRPLKIEVENGVDLALWKTGVVPAVLAQPTFVFLGRLVDWKGVDLLLAAFQALVKTRDAALIVIGGGDQLEPLKAEARRLGIDGKVSFPGFLGQDEVPPLVAASRALVLPSLFECGGAVVLEAMALEKAVIATNWGGPADYLDPRCGILVEPSSREGFIAGLTAAMTTLLDQPELAKTLGRNGRKKIEELYDWDQKVDAMVGYYQQALETDRANRRPKA
jgi:glycosyltransferase involved in cell wall biosynthesis